MDKYFEITNFAWLSMFVKWNIDVNKLYELVPPPPKKKKISNKNNIDMCIYSIGLAAAAKGTNHRVISR